jgi:hypothetical protein
MIMAGLAFTLIPCELQAGTSQQKGQTLEEMKAVIQKASGGNKSVNVLMENGQKFNGHVMNLSEDGFVLKSSDAATQTQLAYSDIRKVKPKGMSTAVKVAIGVGIAAVVIIVGARSAMKDVHIPPL